MSASWLITDGFSGEASGVNKIVTLGLYAADAPTPSASTHTTNWLSPTVSMWGLLFFIAGWMKWH